MTEERKNSIMHDKVLTAIEQGKITRHSKWYFFGRALLLGLGVILAIFFVIFLASFAIFALRQNGGLAAPAFGTGGLIALIKALAWLIIGFALLFLILLQLLVKHYQFSYKQPLVYSVLGAGLIALTGAAAVDITRVHERLFERAEHMHLPIGQGLYHEYGRPRAMDNFTPGTITAKLPEGFSLNTPRNEQFTVVITPNTQLFPIQTFEIGETVVVIGHRQDNTITAEGMREIDKSMRMHMPPPNPDDFQRQH